MKTNLIALFVISIILTSCNTTNQTDVKESDTQLLILNPGQEITL